MQYLVRKAQARSHKVAQPIGSFSQGARHKHRHMHQAPQNSTTHRTPQDLVYARTSPVPVKISRLEPSRKMRSSKGSPAARSTTPPAAGSEGQAAEQCRGAERETSWEWTLPAASTNDYRSGGHADKIKTDGAG